MKKDTVEELLKTFGINIEQEGKQPEIYEVSFEDVLNLLFDKDESESSNIQKNRLDDEADMSFCDEFDSQCGDCDCYDIDEEYGECDHECSCGCSDLIVTEVYKNADGSNEIYISGKDPLAVAKAVKEILK